jgi:ubiquinone biosynthesis protein UbiJ
LFLFYTNLKFDFEEELSKFTGDIVAHQVGRIATKFKSSDNPLAAIKDKITHFLIKIGPNSSSAKRMRSPLVNFFLGI